MNNRYRNKIKIIKGPKFTNSEAWNLFNVIGRHIYKGLIQFKKANINSYPSELGSLEAWHEAIDKMIWSFKEIINDNPHSPVNIEYKRRKKEAEANGLPACNITTREDGLTQVEFNDNYKIVYSEDLLARQKEYIKRVDEGKMLFAKYFEDLWD